MIDHSLLLLDHVSLYERDSELTLLQLRWLLKTLLFNKLIMTGIEQNKKCLKAVLSVLFEVATSDAMTMTEVRKRYRQTDRQAYIQSDTQTYKQTDRQTHRQFVKHTRISLHHDGCRCLVGYEGQEEQKHESNNIVNMQLQKTLQCWKPTTVWCRLEAFRSTHFSSSYLVFVLHAFQSRYGDLFQN